MFGFDSGMSAVNYLGNLEGDDLAPRLINTLLLTTKPRIGLLAATGGLGACPSVLVGSSEARPFHVLFSQCFKKGSVRKQARVTAGGAQAVSL